MKNLLLSALLIVCTACTTLRPLEGDPAELRRGIDSGELLKIGDRVLLVTADSKAHRFAIKSIGSGVIQGRSDSVPIEQVVKAEKRQFSRAKTVALVVGLALVGTVAGLAAYTATHLSIGF